MHIAWNSFTPGGALVGGMLIGAAAALLVLFTGRIAGISGIVAGLLQPPSRDTGWRVLFVLGLLLAPLLYG
ncbi:YeeE/YedE family protein, partial [Herbaspirillum frisingense]